MSRPTDSTRPGSARYARPCVNSVTILSRGRHVWSGSVRDVLSDQRGGQLLVRVADLPGAQAVLVRHGFAAKRERDHLLIDGVDEPARVTECLAAESLYVSELTRVGVDLESVFLELTGTQQPAVPVGVTGGDGR